MAEMMGLSTARSIAKATLHSIRRSVENGAKPCFTHHDIEALEKLIEHAEKVDEPDIMHLDLAMLVRRLCYSIRKLNHNEPHTVADSAMDYLKRKGLHGSILRKEDCADC